MNPKIEEIYRQFLQQPIITTDSRKIIKGCIFFALKGENFDGNAYALQAIENGAAMAVIDNPIYLTSGCILVDDVLASLQQVANLHRKSFQIPVIGITGSNGKTTTKELISAVLGSHYTIIATQGNLNNHIGVPITLLRITKETEIAIIEMGANHQGEIAELCQIAEPTHGIITNIGKAHLGGFGGFQGVIKAKTELYSWLRNTSGLAIVNAENEILNRHISGLNCMFYGTSNINQTHAILNKNDEYLSFHWQTKIGSILVKTNLIGSYNFENALAAICIGMLFNVPEEKIKNSIQNYSPSNSRSQLIKTKNNQVVMDAYNANPTSMLAAINNFMAIKAEKKIMILGDMLELGAESEEEHNSVVEYIIQNKLENTILVGPEFYKSGNKKLKCFNDSMQAHDYLYQHPPQGYTILLKGSRGIKMEKILEAL